MRSKIACGKYLNIDANIVTNFHYKCTLQNMPLKLHLYIKQNKKVLQSFYRMIYIWNKLLIFSSEFSFCLWYIFRFQLTYKAWWISLDVTFVALTNGYISSIIIQTCMPIDCSCTLKVLFTFCIERKSALHKKRPTIKYFSFYYF